MIRIESNRKVGEAIHKFLSDKKDLEIFERAVKRWKAKDLTDSQLVSAYNIYRSKTMLGEIEDDC